MDKRDIVACCGNSRVITSPRAVVYQIPFWAKARSDPLRGFMGDDYDKR